MKKKIGGFPHETLTMPVVYWPTFQSMFQLKKYLTLLVRKSKHTMILYDSSKIDIRFSEELAAEYVFNPLFILNKARPIAVKYYTTTSTWPWAIFGVG